MTKLTGRAAINADHSLDALERDLRQITLDIEAGKPFEREDNAREVLERDLPADWAERIAEMLSNVAD